MQSQVLHYLDLTNDVVNQFSNVLLEYHRKNMQSPLELISRFKSICASQALKVGERLAEDPNNEQHRIIFENWDLETKLWHLAEILFGFRYYNETELLKEYKASSSTVKQENFLRKNSTLKEISLIIGWLQLNSRSLEYKVDTKFLKKWLKTGIASKHENLNILESHNTELLDELDIDSPLRSGKKIDPADQIVDSQNYRKIYELLLANDAQGAIDFANDSGNYSLALILIGANQDYIDPLLDGRSDTILDDSISQQNTASGLKHKLLWKKTVYKLSQQSQIDEYERLIYNYLSGGEIRENINEAKESWETTLLLYLNQLFLYSLEQFIVSSMTNAEKNDELLNFPTPIPQSTTIDDILNTLLRGNDLVAKQSNHPLRIISGSIMIRKIPLLLHNINKGQMSELVNQPDLVRVIAHLAIIQLLIEAPEDCKDITKVIILYISKLSDYGLTDIIPLYLSFFPNEKDARETYSLFLSSITDPEERSKQIKIARSMDISLGFGLDELEFKEATNEEKFENVLRRMVERVISESKDHYSINLTVDLSNSNELDETDKNLCRAIEWFYESSMYEDAIIASITVIRRFLLCGKIGALKQFCNGKNFKKLIKDFDFELHTKTISFPSFISGVTEEMKQELTEYEALNEGLVLIDDWKKFLVDNKLEDISSESVMWKSKDIENSVEKITKTITQLINTWLIHLLNDSPDTKIYREFRSVYVPFLIMELMQIYQYSRLHDWKYIKKAFNLVNEIADESSNDLLQCFLSCNRIEEFLTMVGQLAVIAGERGIDGIFTGHSIDYLSS